MDNYGFIREKVDIKVLILFSLRHLPAPVDDQMLLELTMCDNAINYFDYRECLTELQETGHIVCTNDAYVITGFGRETLAEMESSLPYTIRTKAGAAAQRAAKVLSREAMIHTSHELRSDGSCNVHLGLSDQLGQIMDLQILAGSEKQAAGMEQRFRKNAEALYLKIAGLLLEEK